MRTFSFSEAMSHPGRRLTEHLLEVAREADRTMGAWQGTRLPGGFRQVALLACLCHDTGKATPWFQRRLEDGRGGVLTRHAAISAAITRGVLGRARGPDMPPGDLLQAMAVASVLRHHGALVDVLAGDQGPGALTREALRADEEPSEPLARQWEVFDWDGFGRWLNHVLPEFGLPGFDLGPKPSRVVDLFPSRGWRRKLRKLKRSSTAEDAVGAQLLFSLLIGSDKLDAALYGRIPEAKGSIPADAVARYRQARFSEPAVGQAQRLRNDVYRDVAETLARHQDRRLFTLTAPTGSGKTLTAIETALTLASMAGEEQARIIYCLPFTSIVDQNFDVFREVLENAGVTVDSRMLVKHHHLAEASWTGDEGEAYDADRSRLLTESWKSRVVVTTFVQLVEALLGNRNTMLKKVMQLPGAVVLLDEVQAIPRELWEPVRASLRAWAEVAGTRFVLLTATRPLIFQEGDAVELCRRKEEHYAGLHRVTLAPRLENAFSVDGFVDEVVERIRREPSRSRLIVANTISSARALYQAFRERDVEGFGVHPVYLSTHVTPRDRLRRIQKIRTGAEPWLVVSTQLVEAGVDISMDEVYRDLAPLDAIIQAAGRCNRGGEHGQGRVEVVRLVNEQGRAFGSFVYDPILIEVSSRLLEGHQEIAEGAFLALGEQYFQRMWSATASAEEYLEALNQLDFDTLGNVRLIKHAGPTQTYFVLAEDDPEAERLWERYEEIRSAGEGRSAFLEIKRAFSERLIDVRMRVPLAQEVLPLYPEGPEYYDREVGFLDEDASVFVW